jgi:hypothetical protein
LFRGHDRVDVHRVSVSGNAVHALIPGAAPLVPWLSAVIACVPPIALLATTHSLAILWRLRPDRPDPATQIQEGALAVAVSRVQKWDAVAAAIHERGLLTSHPTTKISEVLRYLHDHRPAMSQRAIGAQVELHHDTVEDSRGRGRSAGRGRRSQRRRMSADRAGWRANRLVTCFRVVAVLARSGVSTGA